MEAAEEDYTCVCTFPSNIWLLCLTRAGISFLSVIRFGIAPGRGDYSGTAAAGKDSPLYSAWLAPSLHAGALLPQGRMLCTATTTTLAILKQRHAGGGDFW